jgi:hypothetical protein
LCPFRAGEGYLCGHEHLKLIDIHIGRGKVDPGKTNSGTPDFDFDIAVKFSCRLDAEGLDRLVRNALVVLSFVSNTLAILDENAMTRKVLLVATFSSADSR